MNTTSNRPVTRDVSLLVGQLNVYETCKQKIIEEQESPVLPYTSLLEF